MNQSYIKFDMKFSTESKMILSKTPNILLTIIWIIQPTLQQTPFFDITPAMPDILEDANTLTFITQIKCNYACICSSNDFQTLFQITYVSTDTYQLVLRSGQLSAMYYDLNIFCVKTDQSVNDTKTVKIFVKKNYPPNITSGNHSFDSKLLDSNKPFVAGDVVYSVLATDSENNLPIEYKITSTNPVTDIFQIGKYSGVITTDTDLRSVRLKDVQLFISVSDSKGKISQFILILTIGLNQAPDISNLPEVVSLDENKSYAAAIFEPVCTDPDNTPGGTLKLTCTVTPADEASKFDISSLDNWFLKQTLDYEKTKQYKISCLLSDNFLNSELLVLTINVIDVNESPYFVTSVFYCSLDESDAGVSKCLLNVEVNDPDQDTIKSIDIIPSTTATCRKFRYDMSTKSLTFSVDYDLEVERMEKCSVQLEVRDEHNLVGSNRATVHITVNDVNDNTCSMPTLTLQPNWNGLTLPTRLANLHATDNDFTEPNNKLTYQLVGSQPSEGNSYFSVATTGEIYYLDKIPESNSGKGFTLFVKCMDGGRPQQSAEVTVLIKYEWSTTTSTTTTTTTTPPPTPHTTAAAKGDNVFDNAGFVALFAVLMAILIIGLVALLYYLIRYRGLCGIAPLSSNTAVQHINVHESKKKLSHESIYSDARENNQVRTNSQYRDLYWKNEDNFETGAGHSMSPALNTVSQRLALPPPPSKPRQAFVF